MSGTVLKHFLLAPERKFEASLPEINVFKPATGKLFMKPSGREAFSAAATVILILQIFSPLTFASTYYYDYYADEGRNGLGSGNSFRDGQNAGVNSISFADASPSPSPTAVTDTYEGVCQMSEMDAAEVARYQKTLAGFQAEQISTLSDQALRKNDPTNKTIQTVQININIEDQPTYPITEIANLLEYDEKGREEMAREFGVDKDTGKLTREQVRALSARLPGGSDKLSKALGINSGGEIPRATYENFKVVLPNGKSVALADMLKMQPQDKQDACLLDRSFIHGKATFQALLDQDLFLGFSQSPTTVKAPQHLTAKQMNAALNSYTGSMLVPKTFEKFVNGVGFWSSLDMWISLAGAANILLSKKGPLGVKEEIDDLEKKINHMKGFNPGGRISTESAAQERITNNMGDWIDQQDIKNKYLRVIDFESSVVATKPLSIFIYGAGWMGAARLAFGASNQILLSSLLTYDKSMKDNYLQLYINNDDYLTDFRKNSDFWMTGKITDWASDLMEMGAPTKIYDVGKVYFIARDSNPDNEYSDSYTSFEKANGEWQVKMDWKGKSENSIFEDIRNVGDYTSLAMYSNNLELGTTIRGNAEFASYYRGLTLASAPVAFLIYKSADAKYLTGGIASLLRIGIFDFVITNIIDPVKFKKDEICDEGKVDDYLFNYKVFTGLSIAQSGWSVLMPEKGLLPFLGGYAKTRLIGDAAQTGEAGWLLKKAKITDQIRTKYFTHGTETKLVTLKKEAEESATQFKLNQQMKSSTIISRKDLHEARALETNPEVISQIDQSLRTNLDTLSTLGASEKKLADTAIEHSKEVTAMQDAIAMQEKVPISFSKFESAFDRIYKGMVLMDPVQLGKQIIASQGFEYVGICKDTSYKIVAYQKLTGASGQNLKKKFDQLGNLDLGKQLNVTGLLGGIGKKVEDKSLTELTNLRAITENPYGMLQPQDLYYIHLDGATQQWFGVYEKLSKNGCFRECHDSPDGYVCVDEKGVTYTDKKTGKQIKLSSNPDRGLLALMMQDLARTLIPNRIITAGLDNACYQSEILKVQPAVEGGRLFISDDSCSTIQCLKQQLARLKVGLTNDLSSSGFGNVVAIYTTEGRITADEGRIRFLRSTAKEDDEKNLTIGTELQAPSLDALDGKTLAQLPGNYISIMGDGQVIIKGNIENAQDMGEENVGELLTILTERGKIEFDAQGKRLVIALYVLAQNVARESIKSIGASITRNIDENGHEVPAIGIGNVNPKVGGENDAKEMNEALAKVQTDAAGNKGGFTVLETPDYKYTITTDPSGKQFLNVLDKKTGETKQYEITGPLRREGNDIIVPTDKGDFRFTLDMQNGQPTLSATGPDGLSDLAAALLAAKGAGGIIAFDPRTGLWYALNGQDIPWNQDFAKRGLSLYNTPDGMMGVAGDNLFAYPRQQTGSGSSGSTFSIPSFPKNEIIAALMLGLILMGVVFVRVRRMED